MNWNKLKSFANDLPGRFKAHLRRRKVVYFILAGLLLLAVIVNTAVVAYWYHSQQGKPFRQGVSFSTKQTDAFGLSSDETLQALINELGVRNFRLMSYWDIHEPAPNKYDFSSLDRQFKTIEQAGGKISLAIGMRQPRWPECHEPAWATNLEGQELEDAVSKYLKVVVERYKDSPALESYQLENEFFIVTFGDCTDQTRERLVNEYNLVKQLDPNHPIIVSLSSNFWLPINEPNPDIYGHSVYKRVFDSTYTKDYLEYPLPGWYHAMRAGWIKLLRGRDSIVHELQAEPWGPEATQNLSIEEQDKSMDAERLEGRISYVKTTGMRDVYWWGSEWWYWRYSKFQDQELWNVAKSIFDQPQ